MDETYIKVRGKWVYLYQAVAKQGAAIDFYLSPTFVPEGFQDLLNIVSRTRYA